MTAQAMTLDTAGQAIIGTIKPIDGAVPPRDWLLCDGALQSIDQFEALFAVIGTRFGGDGVTTFAVPDLRGDHHFAICAVGLFPKPGASVADLKPAHDEAERVGLQAKTRQEQAAQLGPTRPVQHSSELDPEWLNCQCQSMQDAYGRGEDPLHKFQHESELDPELVERQAQNLTDAYAAGHNPFDCHKQVDSLDPEWLRWQAQSVMDAISRGDDPLHRHEHELELDSELVERQAQCLIDAHARGQAPLTTPRHSDDLEPELLERQVQVMKDAYANGVDPLQPLHSAVGDVDPVLIDGQVKATMAACAAGYDSQCAHTHSEDMDSAELEKTVQAMQESYAQGQDPLAQEQSTQDD